ncbi:PREDICTED: probable disease resistance protein At5g66900 [Nelumbo nucifera]|uniref:Probable disease resistance protein At5g66900 n=1 Tax=Nelumbo nucifera TaxID=4432 RepID=A0A1U8AMS9_NELNU|nr:PREDICTED: probable disease resistance protein At5g66900 [Nelumbo nucifera]
MGSRVFSAPELPNLIVGLQVPLQELKMELFRQGVKVVGICAPGGCGKTTLAAMLCQDDQVGRFFKDHIYFLSISSSPSSKVIMQRLFEMVNGFPSPEFQDEDDACKQVEDLLMQKKQENMLLVLDDVWSEPVLQKLLFRRLDEYKMLVTSRTALQSFDSVYHLKTLRNRDAVTLFYHHSAFLQGEYGNNDQPPAELLEKVLCSSAIYADASHMNTVMFV